MAIRYENGSLMVEQVPVEKIASEHGTPIYVYSQAGIFENLRAWSTAFEDRQPLFCFALKANDNLEILKLISQRGFGADVVSGGELFIARKAGIPSDKIVFAGVGKRAEEIEHALNEKIRAFNVESRQELELIQSIARRIDLPAPIHIRVNPDIDARSHPYISTGLSTNKFGVQAEQAIDLIKLAASLSHIDFKGIHVHIGSQVTDISPFEATSRWLKEMYSLLKEHGITISTFDLGGGLGVDYHNVTEASHDCDEKKERIPNVREYAEAVIGPLRHLPVDFVFEPGRSIIANTAVLIVSVLYTKQNDSKKFVIVDGGMNDLIRPSLYQAYHHILPVSSPDRDEKERVDVVGPICETSDFFARDRLMPVVMPGEHLAIFSVGAYGYSLSSNYNGRPRSAEALVDGSNFRVIRRAETYEDLLNLYDSV